MAVVAPYRAAGWRPGDIWVRPFLVEVDGRQHGFLFRGSGDGLEGDEEDRDEQVETAEGTGHQDLDEIADRAAQVGPGAGGDDQRETEQQQRHAVLAVRRVEVLRALPYAPEHRADGVRISNSDPITGQAGWYDVRVRIYKAQAEEPKSTSPQFAPMPPLPGERTERPRWLAFFAGGRARAGGRK